MSDIYYLWDIRLCHHIKEMFERKKIIRFKLIELFNRFMTIERDLLFLFIFNDKIILYDFNLIF
jgi:hypothetical protein